MMNTYFIIGKSFCPYTVNAVNALPNAQVIYLDQSRRGAVIHESLKQKFQQTSVPYIFVNDVFIGGYDDLLQGRR